MSRRRSAWDDDDRPRGPRPVQGALDDLARRLGLPATAVAGPVFGAWAQIVGPTIADHAQPIRLRAGTLYVEVDDPAWATQLRFLTADVVARIAAVVGPDEVRDVKVVVAAAAGGSGPRRRGRRGADDDG